MLIKRHYNKYSKRYKAPICMHGTTGLYPCNIGYNLTSVRLLVLILLSLKNLIHILSTKKKKFKKLNGYFLLSRKYYTNPFNQRGN